MLAMVMMLPPPRSAIFGQRADQEVRSPDIGGEQPVEGRLIESAAGPESRQSARPE
jgi:hypothetical protein